VLALMNSRPAISRLDRRPAASRAICTSCAVSSSGAPGLRGLARSPVARSSAQADQEPVRRRVGYQPERRPEGLPLRRGKPLETAQERDQQLVQAGETHVHLSLCAGDPGYLHVAGPPGRPVQQRRLADARLTPEHEDPAQPVPDRRQHALQRAGLHRPVQQRANRSALLRPWRGTNEAAPGGTLARTQSSGDSFRIGAATRRGRVPGRRAAGRRL